MNETTVDPEILERLERLERDREREKAQREKETQAKHAVAAPPRPSALSQTILARQIAIAEAREAAARRKAEIWRQENRKVAARRAELDAAIRAADQGLIDEEHRHDLRTQRLGRERIAAMTAQRELDQEIDARVAKIIAREARKAPKLNLPPLPSLMATVFHRGRS